MKTRRNIGSFVLLALASLALPLLTGCVVAGYSSSGGAFIWPGGLALVVILVLFLLLRRR